jgi:hypothetical protein
MQRWKYFELHVRNATVEDGKILPLLTPVIIATMLVLIQDIDQVEQKPELATLLADLREDQLRKVLLGLAEEGPEFAEAIEREVTWLQGEAARAETTQKTSVQVDINAVCRQIHKEFRQAGSGRRGYGYYDEYERLEIDPDLILMPHLEKVTALLDAGDVDSAVTLIHVIVEAYIDGLTDLDEMGLRIQRGYHR